MHRAWNKGIPYLKIRGKNHWNWKGGVSSDKIITAETQKAWRHRTGRSKRFNGEYPPASGTKEYKKAQRINYSRRFKNAGKLEMKTIQRVYEDNIKKFGTLSCYLCFSPIEFKKDHLEHKTPLSRGGTNEYKNLGVSCQKCNHRKHTKTEAEFRRILKPCIH